MTEQLILNGERVNASDGKTFDVYDPSSGDVLASVAKATKADVDRAVEAAHAALESKAWGGMAPAERGRIMSVLNAAMSAATVTSMAFAGIAGEFVGVRNVFFLAGAIVAVGAVIALIGFRGTSPRTTVDEGRLPALPTAVAD